MATRKTVARSGATSSMGDYQLMTLQELLDTYRPRHGLSAERRAKIEADLAVDFERGLWEDETADQAANYWDGQ